MKILISILILSVASLLANGQDIITLKNGDDLKTKVLEITNTEIKYKKYENISGPSYTINKQEVFMIRYENGSKDVFKSTPSQPQVEPENNSGYSTMNYKNSPSNDRNESQRDYDRYNKLFKSNLRGGIITTAVGVPMFIIGLGLIGGGATYLNAYDSYSYLGSSSGYYDSEYVPGIAMVVTGTIMAAVGIPLSIIGPIRIGNAVRYKRKANEAKANLSFEPKLFNYSPLPLMAGNQFSSGLSVKLKF